MLLNARGVKLLLSAGLVLFLAGAGAVDTTWEENYERGWKSTRRGDYASAEAHFRAAMQAARSFGERDPRLCKSATSLAWTLYHRGRYSEAEPIALQNLAIQERVRGAWHIEVAEALDAVAVIHHARARYAEAEALRKRSIAIFERTRGTDDPDVAISLNSLAALYRTLGRYAEAEPLLRRAISIWDKVPGPECLDCASSSRHYRRSSRASDVSPNLNRWTGGLLAFGKESSAPTTLMWR